MSDDRLALESGDNLPEFTGSALSFAVKRTLAGSFEVVRVRGALTEALGGRGRGVVGGEDDGESKDGDGGKRGLGGDTDLFVGGGRCV